MKSNQNRLLQSSVFPLFFLLIIWAVFYFDVTYKLNLHEYGLRPFSAPGLIGILTMPLLHGDLGHIASNTVPLLILGICLFYFYKEIAFKVFFISYISCGVLVWLFAQHDNHNSVHIGASGLIYALAGFLVVSGIIRKHKALFGISLLVTFLYGTIIWGVLPSEYQKAIHFIEDGKNISWEGHLFGFLTGVCLAFVYRKIGIQQPVYSWEINNDEDIDDSNPYWLENNEEENPLKENPQQDAFKNTSDNPYTVHYTFIPKKDVE
ncbi:MAG TPA: rhomboid family intramembrane serine protease [Bacteroidia bacterium]|nr:rhomboid family intramembrane serine protease [Bacteroidia bacterium]